MNDEQIERYLTNQKLSGRRPTWLRVLKYCLNGYFNYLNSNNLKYEEIRLKEAQNYIIYLKEVKNLSVASINNNISTLSGFYKYLSKEKVIFGNPFIELDKQRLPKRIPKNILKEKEMESFLKEITDFRKNESNLQRLLSKYRASVISEIMYATGMRICEVSQIRDVDIDFYRGLLKVVGKGGVERITYLNEYSKEILHIYIEKIYPVIKKEKYQNIWGISYYGMQSIMVKELKETCKKLSMKEITSHSFRHSLGYHLLKNGCDIRFIQEILGHKKLRNTEIYTQVDKESLQKVFDLKHPRNKEMVGNEENNK